VLNRVRPESALRLRAAVASGKCLLKLKQFREAYRVFLVVAEEDPNNTDAHRGLGAAAYDMGQLSVAGTHLQKVAELDPADPRPHRLIGLIHKDLSQWEQAEAAYHEARKRNLPDGSGEVQTELATVLIRQGKYADAQAVLREKVPRDNPDWFAADAEALRGLGKRDTAAKLVDQLMPHYPTPRLLKLRGQLLLDDARNADAVGPLEEAVKQSPADFEARYLLGQAFAALGRKDDAARELARVEALKKDYALLTDLSREAMEKPWDAGVRSSLAEICDRVGKPDLAAMWRRSASAANPTQAR
jgi:Flp pilus assembly protein TadD